ncbi:MAG TPA: thioredoxin family protein [Chitinophagaceae bacterium]|nr:thioredoxin family protein [Chitinophagaceae bacterium]
MRRLLLVTGLCALFFLNAAGQTATAPLPAGEVLAAALKTAGQEKKHVLLMFHASWCVWCHRMDTSLNDPAVKPFFDKNYVITHLVVLESAGKKHLENPGAEALMEKYNGKGQGIPFWLVFDPQGNLIADSKIRTAGQGPGEGENCGCPAVEKEVSYFISVLKKSSSISETEQEIIRKRFRENDH